MRVLNRYIILLIVILIVDGANAQSFKTITPLSTITATTTTGEKPQSKVWFYGGYWWTVAPVSSGTYVYRLDGTVSTQLIQISSSNSFKADVKLKDDTTYILLTSSTIPATQTALLIRVLFSAGSPPTYILGASTDIALDSYTETATIDIDNDDVMWLASDGGGTSASTGVKKINVRWSRYPYTTWSDSITIATGVSFDDICAITAYNPGSGSKIGILWSDQPGTQFRFAYHFDGDSVNTWYYETVLSVSTPGTGVGDDHINLKVGSDGTIYAAVKTSYDTPHYPQIGLLVKHPNGTWDTLHIVTELGDDNPGTRPIVLLNETDDVVSVIYTANNNGNDIVYKESPTSLINFPTQDQYLRYGVTNYDNVSSTKQNYSDSIVILFSTSTNNWDGVIAKRTAVSTDNGAGYTLAFDGNSNGTTKNQVLRVEHNTSLNFAGNLTLEAWVNPDIFKNQSIINKLALTIGFDLSLNSSGKITFAINGNVLTSDSSYSTDTWTHIAATYNATDDSMKIYINGILDPNKTTSASLSGNTSRLLIGALPTSSNYFQGSLDEIRIWKKERSADDIRTDMCKKLSGSELTLTCYWNFDVPEGLNIPDLTSNNNFATMHDLENYVYSWSGAAIGNASAYDYNAAGGYTQSITHSDGDAITATTTTGTITGLQVYRVDSPPLRSGATNNSVTYTTTDPLRYWGVKVFGSSTPTYTLVYNYNGHPGIIDESGLNIVFRDNLADDTWADLTAALDQSANTLTKTGLTGTEFTLASTNSPLPVELLSFSAKIANNKVILSWETSTEVGNYGFNVEKSMDGKKFSKIGFVEGNGNSNSKKFYSFEDNSPETGINYFRLKQIDTDGSFEYSKTITINLNVPSEFTLSQNYPNPFNPTTTIDFTLPSNTYVSLKVYDLLGNQVLLLIEEQREAGSYSLLFDGTNLASGNYIILLNAGGKVITKKMTLLK